MARADLAFEPFAQADIARLHDQRLAALETRVEADLAAGQHAALIGELQRLTAAHPTRERLTAQLMLALYRGGRQADALATYRDARETLIEELGIEPGRELSELQQAILAHDPALDALGPAAVPVSDGRDALPMVARERRLPPIPNRTIGREDESGPSAAAAGRFCAAADAHRTGRCGQDTACP